MERSLLSGGQIKPCPHPHPGNQHKNISIYCLISYPIQYLLIIKIVRKMSRHNCLVSTERIVGGFGGQEG